MVAAGSRFVCRTVARALPAAVLRQSNEVSRAQALRECAVTGVPPHGALKNGVVWREPLM